MEASSGCGARRQPAGPVLSSRRSARGRTVSSARPNSGGSTKNCEAATSYQSASRHGGPARGEGEMNSRRHVQRLSLAVLTLLGFAVAAFAETRWVLWYQDVVVVEGQQPAVVWSQWGSSTTKPDCEAQRRKEIGRYEQMSKLFPNDWAKQGDTIIVKRQGKVVRRTSYYCYPNTINPRWEHLRE